MNRVFTELSPRRDEIAQLYSLGLEKKEIARKLYRETATINCTLQKVFEFLGIRNRSELTLLFSMKVTGVDIKRIAVACIFILIITVDIVEDNGSIYRGRRRIERTEEVCHEV